MYARDSSLWQYKVYADIRGFHFPGEEASNDSGVLQSYSFSYNDCGIARFSCDSTAFCSSFEKW